MSSCEVTQLQGRDARLCREGGRYNGTSSGWCLPAPTSRCVTAPRLVADAAPPWATIEVACDLDE